jgi:hypothetical protein
VAEEAIFILIAMRTSNLISLGQLKNFACTMGTAYLYYVALFEESFLHKKSIINSVQYK